MYEDEFYLVLPSNSSMKYFENTTTSFITHLPREIRLYGEWVVGLTEIHVPQTIMHIHEEDCKIEFLEKPFETSGSTMFEHRIDLGTYEKLSDLVNSINASPDISKHQVLTMPARKGGFYYLKNVCECKGTHSTYMSEKIRRIFGFETDDTNNLGVPVLNTFNEPAPNEHIRRDIVATRPASLNRAVPTQLYVYTDIAEPCTVGDTQAPLLRIIYMAPSSYNFGNFHVSRYSQINYVPLMSYNFQNIIIDIRDEYGKPIPFEYGTLTATLHFKRRK